jgi:hypothetical protein
MPRSSPGTATLQPRDLHHKAAQPRRRGSRAVASPSQARTPAVRVLRTPYESCGLYPPSCSPRERLRIALRDAAWDDFSLGMWSRETRGRIAPVGRRTKRHRSDLTDEHERGLSRCADYAPAGTQTWGRSARASERDPFQSAHRGRMADAAGTVQPLADALPGIPALPLAPPDQARRRGTARGRWARRRATVAYRKGGACFGKPCNPWRCGADAVPAPPHAISATTAFRPRQSSFRNPRFGGRSFR